MTPMLTQDDVFDSRSEIYLRYRWARQSLDALKQILSEPSKFPCTFARSAFKSQKLRYLLAGSPFDKDELRRVREGLLDYLSLCDKLSGIDESMTALLILFQPEFVPLTVEAYHQQAWMVMQDWINNDPEPWPDDIPLDLHQPMWSLCFRGVPLFVNVSCPAHRTRKSRDLGPSLVLVTQPRAGFDPVADNTPRGRKVRQHIRDLVDKYDAPLSWPRELNFYHEGGLEWPQYALKDDDAPRTDRCPLVIRGRRITMLRDAMPRTPEPEKMTDEEEDSYAQADYSVPHEKFAEEIIARQKAGSWDLFGLDMSPRMLAYASKSEKARCGPDQRPINWIAGDAKQTGFADDFFDAVICNSVLHHVKDALAFWREVKRMIKPDGFVFVRDLRRPSDLDTARGLVERHVGRESQVVQEHYLSSLQSAYTITEVERQLACVGLTGLSVIELEDRYLDVKGKVA
jgi:FPC/CPF motif-containing protein YcgG